VADRLAVLAVGQGWDGVTVDLESLRRADADGLVLFVRRLRARLPAGTSISVDLMASTSVAGYHAAGYSLRPLAATADVLALMTYDEHGPTWSGPGPVGPLPWQRKALAALLTRVSPSKVDLGVAGYGYSWPTSGTGHDWSVAAIRKKVDDAGGVSQWLPKAGEWTATLPDGTVFWWSDRRSYDLRHDLAVEQHLHGLALWRLGSADPLD
jgi:spore germination protein